jgi:hypothetical protein
LFAKLIYAGGYKMGNPLRYVDLRNLEPETVYPLESLQLLPLSVWHTDGLVRLSEEDFNNLPVSHKDLARSMNVKSIEELKSVENNTVLYFAPSWYLVNPLNALLMNDAHIFHLKRNQGHHEAIYLRISDYFTRPYQ